MSRLLLVVFLIACKSEQDVGEACLVDSRCKSGICASLYDHHDMVCVSGEAGTRCKYDGQCLKDVGLHCIKNICRELGSHGAKCELDDDCKNHLKCGDGVCLSPEAALVAMDKAAARAVVRQRTQEAEKEARLLTESGVVTETRIEHATNPPGPGSRVRVVKTTAEHTAFAACRPDERVIGGGCSSSTETRASYPSEHSDQDTVGARWNCEVARFADVTAYALCAKLP